MAFAADLAFSMGMMSGGEYDGIPYADDDDVMQSSNMASRQMDKGARPKEYTKHSSGPSSSSASMVASGSNVHFEDETKKSPDGVDESDDFTYSRTVGNNTVEVKIPEAWSQVVFNIDIGLRGKQSLRCLDPQFACKLQFILGSTYESNKMDERCGFLIRQTTKRGVVGVVCEGGIDVIGNVQQAVDDIHIADIKFSTEKDMDDFVHNKLDDELFNKLCRGSIGVYYSKGTMVPGEMILTFVGHHQDIERIKASHNVSPDSTPNDEKSGQTGPITKRLSSDIIRYLDKLNVFMDLERPDVKIQHSDVEVHISAADKGIASDVLKDLDVNIKRLIQTCLDDLPVSVAWLLHNEKVQSYIREELKCPLVFDSDMQDRVTMVYISPKKMDLDKFFVSGSVRTVGLQTESAKDFLGEHGSEVYTSKRIGSPNATDFCCVKYLHSAFLEVQKPLTVLLCGSDICAFLKSGGQRFLKSLEQMYNVTSKLHERSIEFTGGEIDDVSKMRAALEKQICTVVLHQELTAKYQQVLKDKSQQVANKGKCYLKTVPVKLKEMPLKDDGITNMATWYLEDRSDNQVSLICGNIKDWDARNGLIVFVNSSFFGEDPFTDDDSLVPMKRTKTKESLGYVEDFFKGGHNMLAVVVTEEVRDKKDNQQKLMLNGVQVQKAMKKCYEYLINKKNMKNVGVCIPMDNNEFSLDIKDIIGPFLEVMREKQTQYLHLHLYVKSEVEKWLQRTNTSLLQKSFKRVVNPKMIGIFSRRDVDVKISSDSLLDIPAECLVVSIGKALNLSEGFVAKLINQECGPGLQKELNQNYNPPLQHGAIVVATPWNLSKKGVKLLLFVVVPMWKKHAKVIKQLVQRCLLLADQYNCQSVAFPVFGTGNLKYPIRDVASAMFDGIDGYKDEAIQQNISQIYISSPQIKNSTTNIKLVKGVQKLRSKMKEEDTIHAGDYEISYLATENTGVITLVVKETNSQHVVKAYFMNIQLYYSSDDVYELNLSLPQSVYKVNCGKTVESIKKAMKDVFLFCEDNSITSVAVTTCREIRLSEYDQVQEIANTVKEAVQVYGTNSHPDRLFKYLTYVVIIVSESYNLEDHSKLIKQKSSWSTETHVTLKKEVHTLDKQCLNTVIIGSSQQNVEHTKQAITQALMENTNEVHVGDPQTEEMPTLDGATSNVNVGTSSDGGSNYHTSDDGSNNQISDNGLNSHTSYYNPDPKSDVSTIDAILPSNDETSIEVGLSDNNNMDTTEPVEDSVSAMLNQGIVDFLNRSSTEFYTRWVLMAKDTFQVVISRKGEGIFAEGQLVNIIQFEEYLDNEFPKLRNSEYVNEEPLPMTGDHFQSPTSAEIQIPIEIKDGKKIQNMFGREIGKAKKMYSITYLEQKKNHLKCLCPIQLKTVVIDFFLSLKDKLTADKAYKDFEFLECCLEYRRLNIHVQQADISEADVDCIVSSVNQIMNLERGVANAIAKKAGPGYQKDVQRNVEKYGQLNISQCRETESGNLKCKHVIHVNCFLGHLKEINKNVISKVGEAIKNCLKSAISLKQSSIAMPLLATGRSGLPVHHCAQESFKAVDSIGKSCLKEVHFVDNTHGPLNEFAKILMISQSQHNQEMVTVKSLSGKLKRTCLLICKDIGDKVEDPVFVQVQGTITASVDNYKVAPQVKMIKQGGFDGIETSSPAWCNDPFLLERAVDATTHAILEKANEFHCKNVVIPTLEEYEGNQQHLELIGETMVQCILRFCQLKGKDNKIERIFLTSNNDMMVRHMCLVLLAAVKL